MEAQLAGEDSPERDVIYDEAPKHEFSTFSGASAPKPTEQSNLSYSREQLIHKRSSEQ